MNRRHPLNYIYFGTIFVLLSLLHVFHVRLVETGSGLTHAFYMIYAVGQCLIEVSVLAFLGAWISEKFPAFAKGVFIVGTFILLLIHLIDFPLMRIMDMSIWYGFSIVFQESFENFLEMLKASNIRLMTWLLMGVGAAVLTVIGIVIFRLTDRLSSRRPLYFSYAAASIFIFSATCALTLFDFQACGIAAAQEDGRFLKTLPWKTTFFTDLHPQLKLRSSFPGRPSEAWHQEKLKEVDVAEASRPNIYLFVAESLREDFITPEIAPALAQFRTQGISFPNAVSAANATHESWFSLFHSVYPFSWEERQPKKWTQGSLPLQIFKKAGYKIHVLSASMLNFYQMDKILLGENKSLADGLHVFADEGSKESYVDDIKCIDTLIEKMQTSEEGNLFIIFFEGTHFDYSWPESHTLMGRPAVSAIDYVRLTYSKDDLEGIKNRYRHAIYHIDHLFNRFLTALQSHPRQEEAVVVFTSDHGEEFFEEGRIFHASNLNRAQTHVPLYYRLPSKKAQTQFSSHLDIFPTLIDHVFGIELPWFDGESVLRPRQKSFAISARYNASRNPYEFLITTEDELLLARFKNRNNIHESTALEIVSRKDAQGKPIKSSLDELEEKYQPILQSLFK